MEMASFGIVYLYWVWEDDSTGYFKLFSNVTDNEKRLTSENIPVGFVSKKMKIYDSKDGLMMYTIALR